MPPLWAGSHSHPAKQAVPTDPGYVFALAAATHFLHAWQTGDLENGMVQLSDGIRHSQNADKLEQFFSNATNRAIELLAATDIKAATVSRSPWSRIEVPHHPQIFRSNSGRDWQERLGGR